MSRVRAEKCAFGHQFSKQTHFLAPKIWWLIFAPAAAAASNSLGPLIWSCQFALLSWIKLCVCVSWTGKYYKHTGQSLLFYWSELDVSIRPKIGASNWFAKTASMAFSGQCCAIRYQEFSEHLGNLLDVDFSFLLKRPTHKSTLIESKAARAACKIDLEIVGLWANIEFCSISNRADSLRKEIVRSFVYTYRFYMFHVL